MGVHEEAVEPFTKLLDLSTQLARERKDEDSAQADISLAHTKLGDVLNLVDRPREALDHLRVALEIDRRLAKTHPDNIPLTRKLYMTYNMLGRVLRSKNGQRLAEPGEAKTYFEGAVDLADKMSAADPDNRLALTDIAVARSSLGEWLLREKNPQAAVAAHRKAVAAAERLNRVSTQTSGNQDILVHTYVRLAAALTGIAQYDEALQSLGKADEYLSQAEKLNPGLSRNAKRKGEITQGEAEVHVAQKRWGQSIPAFARLISIFENQRKRPENRSLPHGAAGAVCAPGRMLRGSRAAGFRHSGVTNSAGSVPGNRIQQGAGQRRGRRAEERYRQAGPVGTADSSGARPVGSAVQLALRSASSTASGCFAMTASSTRVGASGCDLPCSQFLSVAGGRPNLVAN
jgi:tetratricopeptide (TPR) repeat protein